MHMKATDLNRALNYVDDAYLMEVDTPYKVIETESKEIKPMKTQKRAFRILLAAALIGVLSLRPTPAEMLPIHKLESGKTKHYEMLLGCRSGNRSGRLGGFGAGGI